MFKVLLINPNKWGRGITHIWIASHSSMLKKKNIKVELFDATFYKNWTDNEVEFATSTGMFKKSSYLDLVKFKKNDVKQDLQKKIRDFKPNIIFWSAISSHIHSEGEYVNIQNGYELIKDLDTCNALLVTAGLQATSTPENVFKNFEKIDYLIRGESELILTKIAQLLKNDKDISSVNGLSYKKNNKIIKNPPQKIIQSLDILTPYDYSLFDDQVFFRPYNGKVLRAVDIELSRGCIYSCSYCVETVIQKYYSFNEFSNKTGAITNFQSYLRSKSTEEAFKEIEYLNKEKNIKLFRCQDTNFLTNRREILNNLAQKIKKSSLDIKLYIETRPEGINEKSIQLLKDLKVDGIGMGIELADEDFRMKNLNRFANQKKTIEAFDILKKNNIKRTSYNVIGFPEQTEDSILNTIQLNKRLNPDNITLVFYSPYNGTGQHLAGVKENIFDDYEYSADAALRSKTKGKKLSLEKLNYYKKNFIKLVKDAKKLS